MSQFNETELKKISELILTETRRAMNVHPKTFNSCHEGYAVILEEVNELWDEIKRNPRNDEEVKKEAIQVGAMVVRFLYDLVVLDE